MSHDVILNKIATIEKCLLRIKEEYYADSEYFSTDYTRQDSVILNLERASQASIDIATHIIKIKKLGLPNSSRELFSLLLERKIISQKVATQMQAMVGFRNIAVHDYQSLNLDIVVSIVREHLDDFEQFMQEIFTEIRTSHY